MQRWKKIMLLALLPYCILGWNIGKIKYEIWHGENGWRAMKEKALAAGPEEYLIRKVFFPGSVANMGIAVSADKKLVGGPIFLHTSPPKFFYCIIHAGVGPVLSPVWYIFMEIIMLGLLFPVVGVCVLFFQIFPKIFFFIFPL